MKKYLVQKIVYADNMGQLLEMERGGEITFVELKDEIKSQDDIGFIKKNNGERQGKCMVSEVR